MRPTVSSMSAASAVAAIVSRVPLSVLLDPANIVLYGAALGIAQGLRIALRAKVLELMRVEDPTRIPRGDGGSGIRGGELAQRPLQRIVRRLLR